MADDQHLLANAHDDTITEPLRMLHVLVWLHVKVSNHLRCLRVLELNIILLTHGLCEVLVQDVAERFESLPI